MPRYRRTDRIFKERRERKYRLRAKTSRFIPDADRDFAHMARKFAVYIEKHAERLPVSPEQVANLRGAVEEFRDALCKTMQRRTCGPFATMQKNEARQKAEQIVRAVGNVLRAHESLTSVDRKELNLNERPKRLKRRECPQVAPVLTFKGSTDPYGTGQRGAAKHILEYGNDFDNASNAKPHGAARLELFVELVPPHEPVPVHPGQRSGGRLWYLRSYSTSRFEVEFPTMSDANGGTLPMRVCYWGRWADAKGNVGPFSKTCVARVEGDQLALPGARVGGPVFDEQHRRKNVVERLPEQFPGVEAKVVVESGARFALPGEQSPAKLPVQCLAELPEAA